MANQVWDWLAPEVSTNYVKNPIASNSTTDWTIAGGTSGGTLSVDTTATNILFGRGVFKFTGTLVGAGRGPQATLGVALPSATTQVQVWASGAAPTAILLGATSKAPTTLRTEGGYTVYGASFTSGEASGQTTAQAGFAAGALTCYVYIQVEQSSTYTTFVHGDAGPGYVWNGAAGQASSTRYILDQDGQVVYGGSITAIDDRVNVVCETMVGVGLLPYSVESLSLAGETPALFVRHDLKPRDIQLSLAFNATSLAGSHTRRAALLALWPYGREGWLRYNGANSVLQIKAAVAGQFDLDLGKSRLGRRTVIQFTALDPKFSLIYADTTALTLSSSPSSSYARQRTDAAGWAAMSSGLFAVPRRAITGPDGTIYIGTLASGGSAKLQKWTGTAWADVGGAFTGSITGGPIIYDIVPNADWTKLYVLGDFTTVGGTSGFGGVATITLSDGSAAKMGAGVSAGGVPLCGCYVASLSRLYVGGLFTTMNSVSNTGYFCYWDGATWTSVGTTRPTAGVYCMVNDGADNLILGGDFTNAWTLAATTGITATAVPGGRLSPDSYYVWVVAGDGTNFDFSSLSPSTRPTFYGAESMGFPPSAYFTTTSANRQGYIAWTANPGAQFYAVKLATLTQYALDSAGSMGLMVGDVFNTDSSASYTKTNGTMTYDSTTGRYSLRSLKYAGVGLAVGSGISRPTATNTTGATDNYFFAVWIQGTAPASIAIGATSVSSPTADHTDGVWSRYTMSASVAAGANPSAAVRWTGTVTAYIGAWTVSDLQYGIAWKYDNSACYILPPGVTSIYTDAGLVLTSPDAPSTLWTGFWADDWSPAYTGSTGDYGVRIVKHKPANGSYERMAQPGGGFNGIVRSLTWAGSYLVAAGDFTQVDNATAGRVAYTRGKAWLPLGASGMGSGSVYRVSYANGTLWTAGSFASADGNTAAALVARMDSFPTSRWTHTDVALTNSSNAAYDVLALPYRLAVFDDTTYSSAAGGTSISYTGTGNLYPRIVATGPGLLRWIENGLTKAKIVLNYTLQAGETLTIDCDKATIVSSIYGDVTGQAAPSSNLDGWYLAASSTQTVWCHMTGTTAASSVVIQGNRALITGDV